MTDLYHGEYPVDMTPAEAKAELDRQEVKHSPRDMQRLNDAIEDRAASMTNTTTDTAEARALTPEVVAAAIKATEYKYFGDYEFSDDQREAVDVLVEVARHRLATAEVASGAGERCWECSCGWKGCYTAEQIAEHGEPAECNRCCRERLEEVEPASLPPATDPAMALDDETIERVAKAIYEEDDPWHKAWPWPDLNPDAQGGAATANRYRDIARKAIAATKEPVK